MIECSYGEYYYKRNLSTFKGNLYQVLGTAKHSETLEDMVVYKSLKTDDLWVRPAYMWNEAVDNNGTKRFILIEEQ